MQRQSVNYIYDKSIKKFLPLKHEDSPPHAFKISFILSFYTRYTWFILAQHLRKERNNKNYALATMLNETISSFSIEKFDVVSCM